MASSSSNVDYDAVNLSLQIFTAIFIDLIATFNGPLILCVSGCRSPRRYIIACMSFANLFLALFTLLVREIKLFHENDISCQTMKLALIYSSLHSIVTGFSLVMLCAELVFRKKICSLFCKNSVVAGIVLGGAPWIVGLSIILPLHLVDYNFQDCSYDFEDQADYLCRERAVVYVSVILPVCAAVLTSVFIKFIKVSAVVEFYNTITPITNQNVEIVHLQPLSEVNSSAPDYAPPPPFPSSDMKDESQYPTTLDPTHMSVILCNQRQLPLQDNSGPTIPESHSEPASNYIPRPTSAFTEAEVPYTAGQSNPVTEQDIEREKFSILIISCAYAVMFLPLAIYLLTYILEPNNQMDELAAVIVGQVVLYLNYLWGTLYPFMWLIVLKSK